MLRSIASSTIFVTAIVSTACGLSAPLQEHAEAEVSRMVEKICVSNRSEHRRSVILEQMRETGTRYKLERFELAAGRGTNIVVEPVGSSLAMVLLVAHYDCVPDGLGAVDNAAGVAAVMSLLESLSRRPLSNLSVQALFTDMEEAGRLGAKAFLETDRRPQLILNFDTFGYGDVLWLSGKNADHIFGGILETAARTHGVEITWEDGTPPGDDQVFRDAGFEAIGLGLVREDELISIRRLLNGEEVLPKPSLAIVIHGDKDVPEKVVAADIVRGIAVVESALRRLDEDAIAEEQVSCSP